MPRAIWKGAITFGLVNVPVALYPASQSVGVDFDWLDRRSMDPVGYKRINKRTGKEIEREDIVKGIKQPDGEYVVLTEDEIKAAYPKSTQTIEIESFVKADEISFTYLETPYFLAPLPRAEKVYALLREAMRSAQVLGVARVVMHTKERLAALIPDGDALLLNTIRWSSELRPRDELKLPPSGKNGVGLKEGELKMAAQLIADMSGKWAPDGYSETFTDAIHALAAQRVKAGKTEHVTALEDAAPEASSNVVDLTELLKRSLSAKKPAAKPAAARSSPPPAPARGAKRAPRAAGQPARKRAA